MSIRYIIRPAHIQTTPRLIKETLGAQRTLRWPGPSRRKPSILKDFFLVYPPINETEEYAEIRHNISIREQLDPHNFRGYSQIDVLSRVDLYRGARAFASASKPEQRWILWHGGFPVPRTCYARDTRATPGQAYAREPGAIQRTRSTGVQPRSGSTVDLEPSEQNVERQLPTYQGGWFGGPDTAEAEEHLRGLLESRSSRSSTRNNIRELDGGPNIAPKYIVRPLRHSQGQSYSLRSNETDYEAGREYIQEVYPKNHEYRVIICRGEPLITLYKRRPEGLHFADAWNHTNGSSFVTVHNPDNDRLRHTDLYNRIRSFPLFKSLDLIGLDVMTAKRGLYAVIEVNLCPALTIDNNLERIRNHVLSHSR